MTQATLLRPDAASPPAAPPRLILFLMSRWASTAAVQIEAVTIGWQVYSLARHTRSIEESALLVGSVGLAQFLPMFCLSLFAGATVDRRDRRRILLVCTAIECVCVLALMALTSSAKASVLAIMVAAAVFGASRAFLSPAASAMMPMLVARDRLPSALSLNALGDQAAMIVGPWIGGALCALSVQFAYGCSLALYVLGALALVLVRAPASSGQQGGSHWMQIKEGLAFVWNSKLIRGAISLDLFAVLLGGVGALLPIYAADVLHAGATGFGLLRSAPAAGAALMALALARWPLRRRVGAWLFGGVGAYGIATLVFALSRSVALSWAALVAVGASDMVSVYVRQSLVQIATPDRMRGRVSAVTGLFIGGSAELGEFETGAVTRVLGPVLATVVGGVGSLIVTGAWAAMFPSLRNADRIVDAASEPAA